MKRQSSQAILETLTDHQSADNRAAPHYRLYESAHGGLTSKDPMMTFPSFDSVTPVFTVNDLPAVLKFYEQILGFNVAWTWGTPPDRASVCRGNVEITLSTRGLVDKHGPSRVFIQLTDIDKYYDTIKSSGIAIEVPLGDREYGMRDFHLIDPSGNQLSFGQMITSRA